jgi:ornithine carbamoyltransferase
MRNDPTALMNPPTMKTTKTHPPNLLPEAIAPRDLVSIHDLAPTEILSLFNLTSMLKQRPADFRTTLAGKQMVMFFEKPSLRTRLTFEAGMDSLGGSTFFVDQTASRSTISPTILNAGSTSSCCALSAIRSLKRWPPTQAYP